MLAQQRYMKQDHRTRNWIYKREYPKNLGPIDGTRTFVRSFGTSDLGQATRRWSTYDSEFEAKVQQARSLTVFRNSKDARREKFWLSVARWIEFERSQRNGTLALPQQLSVPTSTVGAVAFHTFEYLRVSFLAWAAKHDRDAAEVFRMGDARLDSLFELGLVGAYFVAMEDQKIAAGIKSVSPVGTAIRLGPRHGRLKFRRKQWTLLPAMPARMSGGGTAHTNCRY